MAKQPQTMDRSRRGQTLVEALVALTILMTGFMGIVTLLTKSFQLNRISSAQTQATYLASEGIELAKNLIDHDVYAGLAISSTTNYWGASFSSQSAYYQLDYKTTTVTPSIVFGQPQSTPLQIGPAGTANANFYGYNIPSGKTTTFIRNIKVTHVPAGNTFALQVISTVRWTSGLLTDTVTLQDYFYDWHP